MTVSTEQKQTDHRKESVTAAVAVIRQQWTRLPEAAIILGSGLGGFVEAVHVEARFSYLDLPGFCDATAIGHAGNLVCGLLDGVPVVVMCGRSHCYEGREIDDITCPIDVLSSLGASRLIVSCAAGGLSHHFSTGDLMVIREHVDLLLQPHSVLQSTRQNFTYDSQLCDLLTEVARQSDLPLQQGTYVAVTGPNYETRAEMRLYAKVADAIGMSTVPEVARAKAFNMQVCGIATITNLCHPDALVAADGEHVIEMAATAEPKFRQIVRTLIKRLTNTSS